MIGHNSGRLRRCFFNFDASPTWWGWTDDTFWNGFLNIIRAEPDQHASILEYWKYETKYEEDDAVLGVDEVTQADGSASYAYGFATEESNAIRYYARLIGLGFHPDTRGASYVKEDGSRLFSDEEAALYDRDIVEAFATLPDPYAVAIQEFEDLGLIERTKEELQSLCKEDWS